MHTLVRLVAITTGCPELRPHRLIFARFVGYRVELTASAAGRDPSEIRRLYNVVGSIGPQRGDQGLNGPVELWIETLTEWATAITLDTLLACRRNRAVSAMRTTIAGTF